MEQRQSAVLSLLILLIILVGGAYWVYTNNFFREGAVDERVVLRFEPSPTEPIALQGNFLLSLVPVQEKARFDIYSYSLGTDSWTRHFESSSPRNKYYLNFSPGLSNSRTHIAFARKTDRDAPLQIFIAKLDGTELRRITNVPEPFKRNPVWSPNDNRIAYIAHNTKTSATDPNPEIPESWSVYITDLDGTVNKVAVGTNPIFSPDGQTLLVLQNDGLHAFDVSDPSKPQDNGLVFETSGGRASQTMKIGVSRDKSMLAWPSVATGETHVFRIDSWDPFLTTPHMSIRAKAYWTVFSPDGRYLAQMEVQSVHDTKAIIRVYDLKTGASRDALDLNGFNKTHTVFTAWY